MSVKKGTKYYNNGYKMIRVAPGGYVPDGFVEGKLPNKKPSSMRGKKQYHKGDITKFFSESDIIPDGFVLGPPDKQIICLRKNATNVARKKSGTHLSESTKEKLHNKAIERYKEKENHPMYGKKLSESTKKAISIAKIGKEAPNKGKKLTEEQIEKRDKILVERYGSTEQFYSERNIKMKQTKLSRYNDPTFNNSAKSRVTIANLIASGIDFYGNRDSKSKETINSKYGNLDNYYNNRILTVAKNLGFTSVDDYFSWWCEYIKKFQTTNSKLEDLVELFLKNNNINYTKHFVLKNDSFSHEFDFAVFNDNSLKMLVDCDGLYYHSYLSDRDGKTVNNYSDEYRQLLVPKNIMFFVVVEKNELLTLNDILYYYNKTFDDYVNDIYLWCCNQEFPYPQYTDKVLLKSYNSLCNCNVAEKYNSRVRYGYNIVNNFHKSLFNAHKKGKPSLFDAWNDRLLLKRAIKNRLIYKGNNLDCSRVLYGLSASGIAPKVSIFNPFLAKYLVSKYLNSFNTIFDPFSGYSGRLLGCCSLGKSYIGQDINVDSVKESNNIISYFNLDAKVICRDSVTSSGEYDCLFTCSPYADKELWGSDNEYNYSCDEWIDLCLTNYKCKRYVFVVDDTVKYKDFIRERIVNKSHFGENYEYVIVIDSDIEE